MLFVFTYPKETVNFAVDDCDNDERQDILEVNTNQSVASKL